MGVEGLALLRHLYDGTDAEADDRLAEVSRILDDDSLVAGVPMSERDPRAGYGAWSETYDDPGNLIATTSGPNESKGDDTADEWTPPNAGFDCAYGRVVVSVKQRYGLTPTRHREAAAGAVMGP